MICKNIIKWIIFMNFFLKKMMYGLCSIDYLYNCMVYIFLWPDNSELQAEVVLIIYIDRVQGFSLNFVSLNVSGYAFYGFYSTVGYFTDVKGAGTVVIADLIFVYHGIVMVLVQLTQCCIYKVPQINYQESKKNKVYDVTLITIACLWLIVLVESILYLSGLVGYYHYWNPIIVMRYCKLFITLIKYSHPVYHNFKRKSTKGWKISKTFLDLTGAIFSFASGGLSVQNGLNLTKVILAFVSIIYDFIFIIQHFFLYGYRERFDQSIDETKLIDTTIQD